MLQPQSSGGCWTHVWESEELPVFRQPDTSVQPTWGHLLKVLQEMHSKAVLQYISYKLHFTVLIINKFFLVSASLLFFFLPTTYTTAVMKWIILSCFTFFFFLFRSLILAPVLLSRSAEGWTLLQLEAVLQNVLHPFCSFVGISSQTTPMFSEAQASIAFVILF